MRNPESSAYVLDSFAVLAHLQQESGGPQVRAILDRARDDQAQVWLCIINYGEVLYIVERRRGPAVAQEVALGLDSLPITVVDADRRLTFAAAHVKAQHAISYADAFAVALAQMKQAAVVTGDPEFTRVEGLVPVEWLSDPPPP